MSPLDYAEHLLAASAGSGDATRIEALQAVEIEIVLAHAVVGAMDLAPQGQDQANGELRNGVG